MTVAVQLLPPAPFEVQLAGPIDPTEPCVGMATMLKVKLGLSASLAGRIMPSGASSFVLTAVDTATGAAGVAVGVNVGVFVGVLVAVAVGVLVAVAVAVGVLVGVKVAVAAGVGVYVATPTNTIGEFAISVRVPLDVFRVLVVNVYAPAEGAVTWL